MKNHLARVDESTTAKKTTTAKKMSRIITYTFVLTGE